mmetsp:Transcript_27864/g.41120  ORF Transcript_27864/g.41120 Transcript_27864/m.41120 type:complete len:487 (+) Transcript_27864:154-1614(+)
MMSMAGPPTISERPQAEDAASYITVSDPVQHAEGMNKFTSYRVDVRPPNAAPSEQPQEVQMNVSTFSAVLRRYSDFLWLYERLHMEKAGAIVPPLPEKQPVGRFDPNFIEDRRMSLERFLRRVAVHPELADAKCLDTFLRADDVTFSATKNAKGEVVLASSTLNPVSLSMKPKNDGSFKRWFAEAKTSISGDLVRSPDDDLFEEIHRYVHGLDTQMRNVSHQTTGLVRKGKEIANGLFEFGLAFNLLGQSEADALGDALGKVGETADRLSVLSADHAAKETSQFEDPIQDYIKTIYAVKLALQRRHEKRLSYSTCVASVEAKQSALSRMRLMPGQEAKAYALEMSLRRTQEATQVAQEDFAAVSQRVLREVDRFKREKAEAMRRTVLDYINLQVDYNKKMEEIWATLIPQLEQVQLDNNSNVIAPAPSPGAQAQNLPNTPVPAPHAPAPFSAQHQASQQVPATPYSDPSMLSVQYRDPPTTPMQGM